MKTLLAGRPGNRLRESRSRPEPASGRRARPSSLPALLGRLARERRASAGIELAIGAVAVFAVAYIAFDVYSLTRANAAGARVAAIMADYVTRDAAPDGDEMAALGKFLHEREFGMPSALVYVVSAVKKPEGKRPAKRIWQDDKIRLGPKGKRKGLVQNCKLRGKSGWHAALVGKDASVTLSVNEVVIVVEVCAELLREGMLTNRFVTGNLYWIHALPSRSQVPPAKPVHSPKTAKATVSPGERSGAAALPVGPPDSATQHAAPHWRARAAVGEAA